MQSRVEFVSRCSRPLRRMTLGAANTEAPSSTCWFSIMLMASLGTLIVPAEPPVEMKSGAEKTRRQVGTNVGSSVASTFTRQMGCWSHSNLISSTKSASRAEEGSRVSDGPRAPATISKHYTLAYERRIICHTYART